MASEAKSSIQKTMDEVDVLIRSRYPILYLLTHEESRLEHTLYDVALRQTKALYVWTATTGSRKVKPDGTLPEETVGHNDPVEVLNQIQKEKAASIFLLKDFHPFLEDPHVVRRLRDVAQDLKGTYKSILIAAPRLTLPQELEKDITIIDIPLPDVRELTELFMSVCQSLNRRKNEIVKVNREEALSIVRAAQGLTLSEAENAFSKAVVTDSTLSADDISLVLEEKRQIIRKSGILEYEKVNIDLAQVGGLGNLKKWLVVRGSAFKSEAKSFGLPPPKGVLLLGAPGCGKSLCAKAVASAWKMPLLRLDFGKIFSGLVGSSEENMRDALKVAEGVAPCVLWIDEIEKGLSGGSQGTSDSGTSARVFGTFLTWMQEKESPVFVVATANRIDALPPELLRRGRFDEIFFTDLPDKAAREEILGIHLAKRDRDVAEFDLNTLAHYSEGFSGAELEHCVVEGMFHAFHENRTLTTHDIYKASTETVPLSVTYKEPLQRLREWAKNRARPADAPEAAVTDEPATHLEL